jgi:hypothetical protein
VSLISSELTPRLWLRSCTSAASPHFDLNPLSLTTACLHRSQSLFVYHRNCRIQFGDPLKSPPLVVFDASSFERRSFERRSFEKSCCNHVTLALQAVACCIFTLAAAAASRFSSRSVVYVQHTCIYRICDNIKSLRTYNSSYPAAFSCIRMVAYGVPVATGNAPVA